MPGLVAIWAEFSKVGKEKQQTVTSSSCGGQIMASQGGKQDGKQKGNLNVLVKIRRSSVKLSESEATMCMLMDRFAPS